MERLSWELKEPILDALKVTLFPEQLEIAKDTSRFLVITGGEGGSKSFMTALEFVVGMMYAPLARPDKFFKENGEPIWDLKTDKPRFPHFILFGKHYEQTTAEFEYIEEHLGKLDLLAGGINKPAKPQDAIWRLVTKQGVVLRTWSTENPENIRSVEPLGVAMVEAGNQEKATMERVRGRASRAKSFIIWSGTLENSSQWYTDYALMGKRPNHLGIKSFSLPAWTNRFLFPGGREDPEIKLLEVTYPEDLFAMRVAAEPRPPRDRVLPEVTADLVGDMEIPAGAFIEPWIDPGYATAHAVLFVAWWYEQPPKSAKKEYVDDDDAEEAPQPRKFFYVFDEFYEQRVPVDSMIDLVQCHPMWPRIFDERDGGPQGVMDIAGKGHRDGTESALEVWQKRVPEINWNMEYIMEDSLIERIRTSAKGHRFLISPKCQGLLAELGLGDKVFSEMTHWRFPENRTGSIMGEKPIDKWNHSCKALGYGLMYHIGAVESGTEVLSLNRLIKGNRGDRLRRRQRRRRGR